MKQMKIWALAAALVFGGVTVLTACSNEDNSNVPPTPKPVVLQCEKPDYLKAGDRVALISPSYCRTHICCGPHAAGWKERVGCRLNILRY